MQSEDATRITTGRLASPRHSARRGLRASSGVIAAALAAAALAACGSEAREAAGPGAPTEQAAGDPGLQHIHGLGVDAGRLIIATHGGMFTALEGETKARRLGDVEQDVMGFSVIGPGRFIGSGHPGPGQDGPPNLGLIASGDGGRTWKTISLDGEADFHALVSSGERVYGYDGTQGRLMVSAGGGRTWQEHRPPSGVFSIAIDPRDPDRILAATEQGLLASRDAGRTLRTLGEGQPLVGLLAWPSADRLFLVDGEGQILRSADGGRRWRTAGTIGGQPAAFVADGDDLYAALSDGTVERSADGGATWTVRATP